MTQNNPHIGFPFDKFLTEENLLTEAEEVASTSVTNWQKSKETRPQQGNEFWHGLQKLRATLEQEGIFFDEEDFVDFRDRSPGREVNL